MVTLTNLSKCDLAVLVGGVHVTIPRGGCSSFEVENTFDDHPFVKEGWLTVDAQAPKSSTRSKRSTKKVKKDEPEQPEE